MRGATEIGTADGINDRHTRDNGEREKKKIKARVRKNGRRDREWEKKIEGEKEKEFLREKYCGRGRVLRYTSSSVLRINSDEFNYCLTNPTKHRTTRERYIPSKIKKDSVKEKKIISSNLFHRFLNFFFFFSSNLKVYFLFFVLLKYGSVCRIEERKRDSLH